MYNNVIYFFCKKEILIKPRKKQNKETETRNPNSQNKGPQPGTRPHSKTYDFLAKFFLQDFLAKLWAIILHFLET